MRSWLCLAPLLAVLGGCLALVQPLELPHPGALLLAIVGVTAVFVSLGVSLATRLRRLEQSTLNFGNFRALEPFIRKLAEELRAGKAVRNAIQVGFKRSRLTILDANITTMIAAVVLLYFGRGPVQGFGVTLAIGIFSSVFCALVVTRLLIDVVTQTGGGRLRV